MKTSLLLAKHLKEIYYGRSWTWSNIQTNLKDVTWQEATTKVGTLNTIAVLLFHMNYYIEAVLKVFDGQPFDSHDKYSFDVPDIHSKADWERLKKKSFAEADRLIAILKEFPDEKLDTFFVEKKYGSYYRQFQGIVEHCHYHLGQIAVIKKIIRS